MLGQPADDEQDTFERDDALVDEQVVQDWTKIESDDAEVEEDRQQPDNEQQQARDDEDPVQIVRGWLDEPIDDDVQSGHGDDPHRDAEGQLEEEFRQRPAYDLELDEQRDDPEREQEHAYEEADCIPWPCENDAVIIHSAYLYLSMCCASLNKRRDSEISFRSKALCSCAMLAAKFNNSVLNV
jgi:hypothetical protein